jgi:hypothetical protein
MESGGAKSGSLAEGGIERRCVERLATASRESDKVTATNNMREGVSIHV